METVVLLSQQRPNDKIRVELDLTGRTGAIKIHILSEDKQIHLQYKIMSLILCAKSQLSAFRVLPEATDRVNTQLLQIPRPMGRTLIIMR